MKNLSKKFSVTKTISNSLIPVGKTQENFEKYLILEKDKDVEKAYNDLKPRFDEIYRSVIEERLNILSENLISTEVDAYFENFKAYSKNKKNEKARDSYEKSQSKLRNTIAKGIKLNKTYFEAPFVTKIAPEFYSDDAETLSLLETFKGFVGYLSKYFETKKHLISNEKKAGTIAYRIVDENAIIFFKNILEEDNIPFEHDCSIFDIETFSCLLTQSGIDIYNEQIGKINKDLNLAHQRGECKKIKLKTLHKQILSVTESVFKTDFVENDKEALDLVNDYLQLLRDNDIVNKISVLNSYKNTDEIIIEPKNFKNVSTRYFKNYELINSKLCEYYEETLEDKSPYKKGTKKREAEVKRRVKNLPVSVSLINDWMSDSDDDLLIKSLFTEDELSDFAISVNKRFKTFNADDIKNCLDSILKINKVLRSFNVSEENKAFDFCELLDEAYNILNPIVNIYNIIRNHATKKPYSKKKIKLNFGNGNLAGGWSKNIIFDKNAFLMKRDGNYYLGILNKMNKPSKNEFWDNVSDSKINENDYSLAIIDYLSDLSKDLPRLALNSKNKTVPKNILDGYKIYKNLKNPAKKEYMDNHPDFLAGLISVYMEFLNKQALDFKFEKKADEYTSLHEFYKEQKKYTYKRSFKNISSEYIDELVESGQIFLYQIFNKDFKEEAHGKKNLHTLYLDAAFDENCDDVMICGGAEIFFREKSIKNPIIHKKGTVLVNKRLKNGTPIPNSLYVEINNFLNNGTPLSNEAKRLLPEASFKAATHDIIKDKRYTVDQMTFNLPIRINWKCEDSISTKEFNAAINDYVANNDVNVLGIDRGEKNLLYISLRNKNGELVPFEYNGEIVNGQASLNVLNEIDYNALMEQTENERTAARKNWKEISKIKEQKKGYISEAVGYITELALKNNAVIALEKLNKEFKDSRRKVERQVYQNFETALINKLNYFCSKDIPVNEPGGAYNGLQLAYSINKIDNISQCGIVYFVNSAYTSQVDPTTGFINAFKGIADIKRKEARINFFNKFDEIKYDKEKDMFVFSFDYNNFKVTRKLSKTNWACFSNGERVERKKTQYGYEYNVMDLTKFFKTKVFYNCNYEDGHNLISELSSVNVSNLMYGFRKVIQLRNTNKDYDRIISPVEGPYGFFDSSRGDSHLPTNGDANGAYNIAGNCLSYIETLKNEVSASK